jgi:hypothetical protein
MTPKDDPWQLHVPDHWRETADCVDNYEELAASGQLPDLATIVAGVSPANRLQTLAELVRVDSEYRRNRGEAKAPEDYLREFPELGEHQDLFEQPAPTEAFRVDDTDKMQGEETTPLATVPRPPPAAAPSRIGQYEIREELGHGAFSVVYRAFDPSLEREVAIKLARQSNRGGPVSVAAFQHEARVVAALKHPNLVAVYDFGETETGQPYIVYEYIPGTTLAQRISKKDYTLEQAVRWVAAVADALHQAHKHHVVHRDVKPGNILIDEHGEARLTDFGMAKRDEIFFLDDHGVVLGTPWYMSPEQAGKQPHWVNPAADIYSLGVVLYEVLCGRVPFRFERWDDLIQEVQHRLPTAPRTINDSIPPDLEEACLKALQKDPAERFRTARDMAQALRAAVNPSRRWLLLAGVLGCLALVGAAAAWQLAGPKEAALPPLQVTELRADVLPQGTQRPYRLGTNQKLPAAGDRLQFYGELNREAYVYVVVFDDAGGARLCWPPKGELDSPHRARYLSIPDNNDAQWMPVPDARGVMLVLFLASERPLEREPLAELLALKPTFPPPVTHHEVAAIAKPRPLVDRPGEDVRGEAFQPFRIPRQFKDQLDRTFEAYHAIMFSHFGRGTPDGEAKPAP